MLTPANPPQAIPTPSQSQPQSQPKPITVKKKFHNGWTGEIERLMADWADKAITYRWMHERTERRFATRELGFMFPVIILSTIGGAANFALDSVVSDADNKRYVQLGIGGLSILTGIISTIANRLAYASRAEAHKIAGIHWGKFQRLIAIELSLHPDERSDCMAFLKMCRNELDRLIEQAPTIPQAVIDDCRREFRKYPKVHVPEIVGNIDTTHIFVDSNSRLKRLAEEAALSLQYRKGVLKQIILDDLEPRIQRVIEHCTKPGLHEEARQIAAAAVKEALRAAPSEISKKFIETSAVNAARKELKELELTGVVQSMKQRLRDATKPEKGGAPPVGVGALFADVRAVVEDAPPPPLPPSPQQQQQQQQQQPPPLLRPASLLRSQSAPELPPVGSPVELAISNSSRDIITLTGETNDPLDGPMIAP